MRLSWLQHEHGRCLRHPIPQAGNAQWPELAALLLRDQNLTHRFRYVGPVLQVPRQFPNPLLHPKRLDIRDRLPVNPGRAFLFEVDSVSWGLDISFYAC